MKIKVCLVGIIFLVLTVLFCVIQPKMHKPFQLNIIEYILKINKDGSVTTIKSITSEVKK